MKKWPVVVIFLYIIAAVILILTAPKKNDNVKILIKKQYYSQVFTSSSEYFEVILYLSEKNTFISTLSAINDARISSDDNEIEVKIVAIDDLSFRTMYQNIEYYAYRLKMDVSRYSADGMSLRFYQPVLSLTYDNDETINLDIGEVYFQWNTIEETTDFDYYRLYGIYGEFDGKEMLQGLAIGFDQFVSGDISISGISIGFDEIILDLSHMNTVDLMNENQTLYEALGEEYHPFETSEMDEVISIVIEPEILYAIPFRYPAQFIDLTRFSLSIDYQKRGENKSMIIDDFIYKSQDYSLSEDVENVTIIDYRYRDKRSE